MGGMHTVFALAMALEERERVGAGMLVEVPLVESALNLASEQVIEWTAYGEFLTRRENRGPVSSPQAVFECQPSKRETRYEKKFAALSIVNDAHWATLVDLLGRPEWATPSEYSTEVGRRAAEDVIEDELAKWFASQDCDEVVDRLLSVGLPAATLINGYMISPNPQLDARGFRVELEHALKGTLAYAGLPFQLSNEAAVSYRWAAPTMGAFNEEVLGGELGLSEAELADLSEKQVIGIRPAFDV